MSKLKGIPLLPGQTVFYRPIKNQPEYYPERDYNWVVDKEQYTLREIIKKFSPYQPGQRFYVKEPWTYVAHEEHFRSLSSRYVAYSSVDDPNIFMENLKKIHIGYKWNPARTMPESAARKFGVILNVGVLRVQDINPHNAWKFYYKECPTRDKMCKASMDFCKDFIKKHGQAAWDDNHYIFIFTVKIEGQ